MHTMTLRRPLLALAVGLIAVSLVPLAPSAQPSASREAQLFNAVPARSIGPANMGGRITDLAVVESNPDVMYVAAATGGVWKTSDAGATWRPVFDDAGTLCVGDVTVAPSNPDVVWVGTGEGNILRSVSIGDGVYRSTDGGKSFKHMGLKETRHIGRIVIHPKNPDVVYVAALGHAWGPNGDRGIFKSTDGGKTWKLVLYVNETTGATDLAMDPADPETLYACAYTFRRDAMAGSTPRTQYGREAGIYKTSDGGKSWARYTDGLPSRPIGRVGIDIYRKDPNIVYAWIQTDKTGFGGKGGKGDKESDDTGGIYRSNDKGKSWTRISSYYPSSNIAFYFGQIRVDPNDDQRVYILAVNLSVSTDGGKTFNAFGGGTHPDHHALWINPKNSDHLVLGNDGGLYFSKNRGKAWQAIRGMAIGQFYAVGVDMRKPYRVYGGLQDNGSWGGPTMTYNDAGITLNDWKTVGGGDGFYVQVDPSDPDIVYCEQQHGVLRRVSAKGGGKGGGKVIQPKAPKGETYRFNWNSPIHISPHQPKTIYFGGQYLFRSPDRGDTWETISPDLTHGGKTQDTGHTITTIAESPITKDLLWVGTDDGRVHVSKNGGKDWTEVTKNIPVLAKNEGWITRVECSAHAEGTCFVTVDRHRNDDLKPYVYRTTDHGASWTPIIGDLPKEGNLHCVRQSSKNPDLLFVGTEFGLYGTLDGGKHWHHMKAGIPPAVLVHDLMIHPRERELVVGTHGRSIYVVDISPLEEMTPKVLDSDVHLFEVRPAVAFKVKKGQAKDGIFSTPNPPYGATVYYHLKDAATQDVVLTILDKDGKTLATLKGEPKAGLQKVVWNLRNGEDLVMPGEYTARLQIGERTMTRTVRVEAEEPAQENKE
jgi:photosystem II stability/assembly factor-like uncharacterized protein